MKKHNVFNLEQKILCKLIARLYTVIIFFSWRDSPLVGLGLLLIHEDFLWFLDHIRRHTTVGRTPLDE